MTDKLINIRYATVNADVTIRSISAKSEVKLISAKSDLYDNKINVVVVGAEETSVPTSGKYLRALSEFVASETSVKTVARQAQSGLVASDTFFTLSNFNRVLVEILNSTDAKTALATKLLQSTFTHSDISTAASGLYKTSGTRATTLLSKFIATQKTSGFISTDLRSTAVLKFTQNSTVLVESLNNTVDYNRSFFDLVDITDDYYGLSNVDDDQTAYFDKRLVSVLYSTQLSSRLVLKPVTTTVVVSQVRRALTQAQKREQVVFADLSTRRPRKNNVEVVLKSDLISKFYSKPLKETRTVSDLVPAKLTAKNSLEVFNANTLSFVDVYKNAGETANLTETAFPALTMPREFANNANIALLENKLVDLVKSDQTTNVLAEFVSALLQKAETTELFESFASVTNYTRDFYSYLYATDDYYGQANIDDDQIAAFNKAVITLVDSAEEHQILGEVAKSNVLTTNSLVLEKNIDTVHSTPYIASETYTGLVAKILQSNLGVSEIIEILRGFFLFSNTTTQDQLKNFVVNKTLETTSSSTEIISSNSTKILDTNISLVDPKSFYLSTTPISQVTPTTSLINSLQAVYATSVNSTQHPAIFANNLNLLNSISSVQDLIDILSFISYSVLSQVFTTDTGYANNQNYFSAAYVEPGYVGTNSYFS
jgi:hypothetical protein